jgi:hypothetical protein
MAIWCVVTAWTCEVWKWQLSRSECVDGWNDGWVMGEVGVGDGWKVSLGWRDAMGLVHEGELART